jgi:hypothetical protein
MSRGDSKTTDGFENKCGSRSQQRGEEECCYDERRAAKHAEQGDREREDSDYFYRHSGSRLIPAGWISTTRFEQTIAPEFERIRHAKRCEGLEVPPKQPIALASYGRSPPALRDFNACARRTVPTSRNSIPRPSRRRLRRPATRSAAGRRPKTPRRHWRTDRRCRRDKRQAGPTGSQAPSAFGRDRSGNCSG